MKKAVVAGSRMEIQYGRRSSTTCSGYISVQITKEKRLLKKKKGDGIKYKQLRQGYSGSFVTDMSWIGPFASHPQRKVVKRRCLAISVLSLSLEKSAYTVPLTILAVGAKVRHDIMWWRSIFASIRAKRMPMQTLGPAEKESKLQ